MTLPTPRPSEDEHDWLSVEYVDDWVAEWSSRAERADQLRRVAAALPIERSAAIEVLDVGGGWGPLTEAVLLYRPRASVTLVDFSPPMLEHARQHLAAFGDRVHLAQRDLTEIGWAEHLGGSFDAVVSSLAIHNLRDPGLVSGVYAALVSLLKPRSWFFNLEIVFPASEALGLVAQRLRILDQGADPDQVGGGAPAPTGASAGAESTAATLLSLERQLTLLRRAGFADVDCLWRDGVLPLLAARTR